MGASVRLDAPAKVNLRLRVLARETSTNYLWLYPGNGSGLSPRVQIGTGFNIFTMIAE